MENVTVEYQSHISQEHISLAALVQTNVEASQENFAIPGPLQAFNNLLDIDHLLENISVQNVFQDVRNKSSTESSSLKKLYKIRNNNRDGKIFS